MAKTPEVSEKNKKNEILDAYYTLLDQIQSEKTSNPKEEKKKKEESEVVAQASSLSFEGIVKSTAELKLQIGTYLEDLEDKLLQEHRQFTNLEEAIKIGKKDLENIHGIAVNADSLTALMEAHIQEERKFNDEMAERKAAREKEQQEYEAEKKEQQRLDKQEREREEEEYLYKLSRERKTDRDAYEQEAKALERELEEKRATVEKALEEREQSITASEEELTHLRDQAAMFPEKLEQAITETRTQTENEVKRQSAFEVELRAQETESERTLHQQRVETLEAKIFEQKQLIEQLAEKANSAGQQVQNIAEKAIEGASRGRNYGGYMEMPTPVMKTVAKE